MVAWTASGAGGIKYLALFNLGNSSSQIHQRFDFYKLAAAAYARRNLWTNVIDPASNLLDATLPPHGSLLLELKPAPRTR